jgi:hypothetical protein
MLWESIAGFLRGVITDYTSLRERGILIHNDPFENRQQGGSVLITPP